MKIDVHMLVEGGLVLEGGNTVEQVRIIIRLEQFIDPSIGFLFFHQPLQFRLQSDEIVPLFGLGA